MFASFATRTGGQEAANPTSGAPAPSGLAEWWPVLEGLGLSHNDLATVERQARLAGVCFQRELVASGVIGEADLFYVLARHLGLDFVDEVRPESLLVREPQCLNILRRPSGTARVPALDLSTGQLVFLIAPQAVSIPAIRRLLARHPRIARMMRVVPPSVLRGALMARAEGHLSQGAVNGLFEKWSHLSARLVMTGWQGAVLGALVAVLGMSLLLWTGPALLGLHIVLSLSFLSCVTLRLLAAARARSAQPGRELKAVRTEDMPVYTVIVALYKEAEIVPDLLMALGRIVWPRSKLEIKLVCERDDHETLRAIAAHGLRPCIEVIEVPGAGPRTKPKALSYALPMTSGEFLVLFDAEDRPHPFQLIEAWQRFREGGEDLACLQAPLVISNRHESWLSRMFAFEYAALFHGILPWLAGRGLVLPLGGTSNHFRRSVLERVGGWDPYNVTEDADLGLRLRRFGYRVDTIASPTYEDAPTTLPVWLPQRTRWFKGWFQTWLVHMRDAPRLARELGLRSFLATQVLFPGMLLCALGNLLFLLAILAFCAFFLIRGSLPHAYGAMLLVDLFNIVCGYGAFLALGWWTLPPPARRSLWKHAALTPAYWMLLSLAAWRALWQLYTCPHHWEKTPHRPHRPTPARPQRRKPGPEPTTAPSSSPIASMSRPG